MAFVPGPAGAAAAAPDGEPDIVGNAVERCKTLVQTDLREPVVSVTPPGPVTVAMLPLRPLVETTRIRSVVDIMANVADPIDLPAVRQALRDRRWGDLPPFMRPRMMPQDAAIQVNMTLVIVNTPNSNNHDVVKLFEFERLSVADAQGLVHGDAMMLRYSSPRPQLSKSAFYYLLEQMGGTALLWHRFQHPDEDEEDAAIDAGFDYIEATAPRDTTGLALMRWVEKSVAKDTPVHGWSRALLEKAAKALSACGCLARQRTEYPLTLRSVNPVFLQVALGPLLPKLRRNSLMMLGEPNIGKTPVAWILAFMKARYWVAVDQANVDPKARGGSDLDFFRGDPGTKYEPFLFDDGDVSELEAFTSENATTRTCPVHLIIAHGIRVQTYKV